ncbi:MAG: gas vesicle protein K [Acidobacteria bacterium]|nr:MAG: gas vesicle protein K [Acidobacteriota bacterium]
MTQSHKSPAEIETEIRDLTRQLEAASQGALQRIDCNAETIEQGLAKLVLGLIELLRRLLERQAIRRMEGGSLSDEKVEAMGQALMKLETKINEMAAGFGLKPEDLNLELGPLGKTTDDTH